ncbi:MAG: hypothetical protein ACREQ5_00520 [Candidatus Dormibacteria bacterium]
MSFIDLRLQRLEELRELRAEQELRDSERMKNLDAFEALGYIPTPKQQEFHNATEFDVLFGGAAGPGKSLALLMEGIRACVKYPGLRVGVFRRTFPELEESLLTELARYEYAIALGAHYDRAHHDLRFPNGSLLMFRYAESMVDATRRQGGQYQLLLFDERTLTPPDVIEFLCSRLRSGDPSIPVLGIRSSTNPGGPGHSMVRQRYVDATDYGANVVTDSRGRTVRFIPARLADNPHINREYARDLDALPEAMRAAFRDGSWSSFNGQVFVEWSHDRHVVPRFTIPTEWQRYAGLDYGWTAPTAVVWAARDNDGRLWLYRELTMRQTPEREQARRILEAEGGESVVMRAADPSMWGRSGSALPPSSQYALEGCYLTKADNDRLSGKLRIHTYLAEGPACAHHRSLGQEMCPMLHVLDGTCPELVRTLPALPYDPRRIEDVDTNAEDHHYDSLRYLALSIGTGPQFLILDEVKEPLAEIVGQPLGQFAYIPQDDDMSSDWWNNDMSEQPIRGATRQV